MTMRELCREVGRSLGKSEASIDQALAFSDRLHPGHGDMLVAPEQIPELRLNIAHAFQFAAEHPDEMKARMLARLDRHHKTLN